MIEDCENIVQCEKKLYRETKKVNLLGELNLSAQEIDKLAAFIKEKISEDIKEGTDFLKTRTPACLAVFLVWKGILDYRSSNYWSAIKDSTGLAGSGWKVKWGDIFIDFLDSNGLPSFNIKRTHRYLTPILIHGMIPGSCLDDFFREIFALFDRQEIVDFTSYEEINFYLHNKREDSTERKIIEKKTRKLRIEKYRTEVRLREYKDLINVWERLEEIEGLESESSKCKGLDFLPQSPSTYRAKTKSEIKRLQEEIENLEAKESQYEHEIEAFSEQDRQILIYSDRIAKNNNILRELVQGIRRVNELKAEEEMLHKQIEENSALIFTECWDERYGEIAARLSFEQLKEKIEELNIIKANNPSIPQRDSVSNILRIIQECVHSIFSFFFNRSNKTIRRRHLQIREILGELPIVEEQIEQNPAGIVRSLTLLRDIYESLCHLRQNRESIDEENRGRINRIEKAIRIPLAKLIVKKESSTKELQDIDDHLAGLADGDIQMGIQRLIQLRDTRKKAKLLSINLVSQYPNLHSLELEKKKARQNDKDRKYYAIEISHLDEEVKRASGKITELVEKFELIMEPFQNAGEPVRKFLLHGGNPARDFFVRSIQMVNQRIEGREVISVNEIGLPARVVAKFQRWWEEHASGGPDVETTRPAATPQKRFRAPIILLDTALAKIYIRFSPQSFAITGDIGDICLVMNGGVINQGRLNVYRYDDELFQTEELEFSLPSVLDRYQFCLKTNGDVIRRWDSIQGIASDHPFMAFDDSSKKLIQKSELTKGVVWIVSHRKYDLEPAGAIAEEASLSGKWRNYVYRKIDLGAIEKLDLVDKGGRIHSIRVSQQENAGPVLCGGHVLSECHSDEDDIYTGQPPRIRIPVQSIDAPERWLLSIIPNGKSTLDRSLHFRLKDLRQISDAGVDEGMCEVPLSGERCLGNNPVGSFTVRLKNDAKNIDRRFSFSVLPDLKVEFKKQIYLPCEDKALQISLELVGVGDMVFEPRNPAKIVRHKGRSWEIETNTSERNICGTLRYPSGKGDSILMPIVIPIPRLTWRIEGLPDDRHSSESCIVEELWFGDWQNSAETLSLIVRMPLFIRQEALLYLRNSEQMLKAEIMDGRAGFNLLRFSDTLRSSAESLQVFELTVYDSVHHIDKAQLFRVRTKWEVKGIQCIQSSSGGKIKLIISWRSEHGAAEGRRVVRLWRTSEPHSDLIITKQVLKGFHSMEINEEQIRILPGKYRIDVDVEDEWSDTKPSMPSRDYLNTAEIEIREEEIMKRKINIVSVLEKNGRIHNLKYKYSIQIEGKIINGALPGLDQEIIVKPVNEGWHVGNVSVSGRPESYLFEKVNPLKLEIDANHIIRTAEDRDGDGACFCTICKVLFWSNDALLKEKKMGHDNENAMLSADFGLRYEIEETGY